MEQMCKMILYNINFFDLADSPWTSLFKTITEKRKKLKVSLKKTALLIF